MKNLLICCVALSLILTVLFSCASPAPTPTKPETPKPAPAQSPGPDKSKWPSYVNIVAPSGGSQKVLIGLSSVIKEQLGIPGTVQTGSGGAEYIRRLNRKEADIGIVTSDVAFDAQRGTGLFTKDGKQPVRQVIMCAHLPLHFIALADSGIKKGADLKGKRFIFKSRIQPFNTDCGQGFLDANGITDAIILEMAATDDVNKALIAKTADAGIRAGAPGASYFVELGESVPIIFVPASQAEIDYITKKYQYFGNYVIKANTYKGQTSATPMITVTNNIVVRADLPEDFIYELTKLLMSGVTADSAGQFAKFDGYTGAWTAKSIFGTADAMAFHPGAIKYFKEKGFWNDTLENIQKKF